MPGGPVILITGASAGIGAAVARRFAREGYHTLLAARRFDRLAALAQEIQEQGGQATPIAADLSRLEDTQRLASTALESVGQIDILFNNAGFGRLDWLEALDPVEDVQGQIELDLLGLIWLTQAVAPHMIGRRSGHIINMGSLAGWVAPPTYSVYSAAKFGVRGFTEALRRELGVYGVKVSGIYPGAVDTDFSARARVHRKSGVTTPARMRLTADGVAEAVLRLAQRPQRTLILPGYMRLVVWLNAISPALVDWVIRVGFVKREIGQ
jgi:short-subunit dehydrogenase